MSDHIDYDDRLRQYTGRAGRAPYHQYHRAGQWRRVDVEPRRSRTLRAWLYLLAAAGLLAWLA